MSYLHTADPRALTFMIPKAKSACRKKIRRRNGQTTKTPLINGKDWRALCVPVKDFDSLFGAVGVAAKRRDGIFVQGALTDEAERLLGNRSWIRRISRPQPDNYPITLREVPRHALIFDIDDVPLASLGFEEVTAPTAEDRESFVRAFIAKLPPELRAASVIYQWTSGAGVEGERGNKWINLKLRLFYWLDRPELTSTVKAWVKWAKIPCDDQLYKAAQPIFVASPIFDGLRGPLRENERVGIIRGERDEVIISAEDLTRARAVIDAPKPAKTRTVTTSGEGWRGRPLRPREKMITLAGLTAINEAQQYIARNAKESRHNAIRNAAIKFLAPAALGSHISVAHARTICADQAQKLGLGGERVNQVVKAFDEWALKKAKALPEPRESDIRFEWGSSADTDLRRSDKPIVTDWLRAEAKEASTDKIICAVIPAGGGKTYGAVEESLLAIQNGERRLIAVKTEALAEEIRDQAGQIDSTVPVQVILGALKHCKYAQDAVADIAAGDEAARLFLERLRNKYAEGGRDGLCGRMDDPNERCEFARSCEGAKKPTIQSGALVVTTHAMLDHLKLEDDRLVYHDEAPPPVNMEVVTAEDFASLRPSEISPKVEDWSKRVYSSGLLAPALQTLHSSVALIGMTSDQSAFHQRRHPTEIKLSDIDRDGALAALGEHMITEEAAHNERITKWRRLRKNLGPRQHAIGALPKYLYGAPPRQNAAEVRAGRYSWVPSRKAWDLVVTIAKAAARGEWSKDVGLLIDPMGRAEIERYSVYKLPAVPIIALDATGDRHLEIWKALGGAREVEVRHLHLQGGAPDALWVQTTSYTSSQLIERHEGKIRWKKRAEGALKKLAEEIAVALVDRKGRSLGIMTHKFLADLMRTMIAPHPDYTPYENDPVARKLLEDSELANLLAIHRFVDRGELIIGHFGADDVGSNKMKSVDTLAIVGFPNGDLSGQFAMLKSLNCGQLSEYQLGLLDEHDDETSALLRRELEEKQLSKVYRELGRAKLSQSIARARALRRTGEPPRVLYIGHVAPSEVDPCNPGIEWKHRKVTSAKAMRPQLVEIGYECETSSGPRPSIRAFAADRGITFAEARTALNNWNRCSLEAGESYDDECADPANPFIRGFNTPLIRPFANFVARYIADHPDDPATAPPTKRRGSLSDGRSRFPERPAPAEEEIDELIRSRWKQSYRSVS